MLLGQFAPNCIGGSHCLFYWHPVLCPSCVCAFLFCTLGSGIRSDSHVTNLDARQEGGYENANKAGHALFLLAIHSSQRGGTILLMNIPLESVPKFAWSF